MQQKPCLWRHGILISIMVVSFMIFVLRKAGVMSAEYDNQIADQELAKFNGQFEIYAKEDNTFFDVITVANLAWDVNKKNGWDEQTGITINIIKVNNEQIEYSVSPSSNLKKNYLFKGEASGGEQKYIYADEIIGEYTKRNPENTDYIYKFSCIEENSIKYNELTGKVKEMSFKIVENK